MKILEIKSLAIPDIKTIRFARFQDNRGYFTEQFRKSELFNHPELNSMKNIDFVQANESYSKKGVVRGLHFQWDPYMGKLVRIIQGKMIDLALDIRKGSETYSKIIGHEMSASKNKNYDEWLWIPPGFAHGFCFLQNSSIEYFCSGEYNSKGESGISPLAEDIDWSLCDLKLEKIINNIIKRTDLITEKDRNALKFREWDKDTKSNNFIYGIL